MLKKKGSITYFVVQRNKVPLWSYVFSYVSIN